MNNAITALLIQIKADATQALQTFKQIVTGTRQVEETAAAAAPALATVTQEVENAGQAAQKTGGHIAGMSYYFRSFFDSMRFAMLGNPMAAFYMVDEGVRALVASGVGLMPIAGIITGIGAAIAGSYGIWYEFGGYLEKAAEKAAKLTKALEKIPDAVKDAFRAQQLGAITEEVRKKFEDYLSGKKKLYVGPGTTDKYFNLTEQEYTTEQVPMDTFGMNPYGGGNVPIHKKRTDATRDQILGFEKQEINRQMAANADTVAAKEVAQTDAEETQKIDKPQVDAARQHQEALEKVMHTMQDQIRAGDEYATKQEQADQKHTEQLRKQAEMEAEMARAKVEAQIQDTEKNPLLTDPQKLAIIIPLEEQLLAMDQARAAVLEKIIQDSKSSFEARLDAQKQLNDLTRDQQELQDKINEQKNSGNVNYQWTAMFASQMDQWRGWAQESADSFAHAWDGATNSVSAGLTHLFEYGAQRGQWFRTIWNGVIGSMISSTTSMVVDWVSKHIVMQGISMAFHATENALQAESVAAHTTGETEKTTATTANSVIRQGIYMAETVFHGVMVALRVAAHIAGEVASTAITAAQAMLRAMYHAIAAAIGAMESEASVPYVGPILGIAAAAAMMAVAMSMMGGFEAGGYTGDGPTNKIAGIVHAGEYVTPASRTSGAMGLLRAIHSGALTDASAPQAGAGMLTPPAPRTGSQAGGQVQHVTHIGIYHDKAKMAQDLQQSEAHEKWVASVSAKTVSKFKS